MEKRMLGRTGFKVSGIGLGTVQFGLDYGFTKRKSQDEVDKILDYAEKKGINLIDTARRYGDSEEKIGNYISQNTNSFVIATKLGEITETEAEKTEIMRSRIYESVEESLKMLKVPRLHLLQLHTVKDFLIRKESFWRILADIKAEKLVASLGASLSVNQEDEIEYLLDNCHMYLDFLQIPYNIFDRAYENCKNRFRDNNIGIIGRSAFLKGIITCDINSIPEELAALRKNKERLLETARGLSMEVSDIALLFVYNKKFIDSTILGIDSVKELELNARIVEEKKLDSGLPVFDELKVDDRTVLDPSKWVTFK